MAERTRKGAGAPGKRRGLNPNALQLEEEIVADEEAQAYLDEHGEIDGAEDEDPRREIENLVLDIDGNVHGRFEDDEESQQQALIASNEPLKMALQELEKQRLERMLDSRITDMAMVQQIEDLMEMTLNTLNQKDMEKSSVRDRAYMLDVLAKMREMYLAFDETRPAAAKHNKRKQRLRLEFVFDGKNNRAAARVEQD